MTKPGRKRKPSELKQRQGNFRPDKDPEPVKLSVIPPELEPPEDLDETAKDFWHDVVPTLQRVGILETVDRAALEMMSIQYARAKQAGRVIAEEGHLARGSTGQLVEHPSMATERAAISLFLRLAGEYALTPVARTNLGLAELQRRSLAEDMHEQFGKTELEPA